jgi:hypothetical protein
VEAELLVLGAHAPVGAGLVAGREVFDQLPPILDRRAAARRWCGHSIFYSLAHAQPGQSCERRGHMSYSHASTRLVHDVQLPLSHTDGGKRKRRRNGQTMMREVR